MKLWIVVQVLEITAAVFMFATYLSNPYLLIAAGWCSN